MRPITTVILSVYAHSISMEQVNAHKLSSAAQHERRQQVIRALSARKVDKKRPQPDRWSKKRRFRA